LKYVTQVFFKENVRYPVCTCRDPILSDSKDPITIFVDSRDPIFSSRDPTRVPKTSLKNPDVIYVKICREAKLQAFAKTFQNREPFEN